MRPLELRLAHFGPYRDEVVLDFEALDRLFLVCGPTGAGKTTLFDALTYALYERTPGTRGGLGDQLASHHAPEGSVPRVSLRFALGNQQWRVTRHLKHRVAKQRGEGWRDQDAQVLLETKKDDQWEPVPGKRSEINQRIEALIGLSAEEFAKIVVLPQGDFQRFLEATSSDREKMLQKLFPVETYERLVEALKTRAKTVEEARRRWEDRWQELTGQLTAAETGRDRAALEAAWDEAAAQAAEAARQEAETAETLARLRSQVSDWQNLMKKQQEQAALISQGDRWTPVRERVSRGRQVRPLVADLDRQTRIVADGKELRLAQDRTREDLIRIDASLADWAARADERAQREARLAQVQQDKGLLVHQKTLWAEAQTLETEETKARAAETRTAQAHQQAQAARAAAVDALPAPPPGPGWDEALTQLDQARETHRQTEEQRQNAERRLHLQTEAAEAEQQHRSAAEALAQADSEVRLWTQLVEATQAAALAETLRPDQPCPVCGSPHHPQPAPWPEAAAEAPRRLEAAQRRRETCLQAEAQAAARVKTVADQLAPLPLSTLSADPAVTGALLTQAQTQVDTLRLWMKADTEARARLETLTAAEVQTREAWQAAVRVREGWTLRRQSLTESVPADPTPRWEALVAEESRLRHGLDEERKAIETLGRQQSQLQTRIAELEHQLVTQREEFRKLQTALEAAAQALSLTLDEVRQARIDEDSLQALERDLAEYDRETHRLEGEITALRAKFPQGPPDDPEPVAQTLETLRQRRSDLETQAKELEFALRDRDRIEEALREVNRQKQALEADFQRLVPVARVLNGHNDRNLRFTTWVLVQALEQVARSATHRLASLSGGRYALKVQSQGADARRDWGLDLAVVDGYTGQERAVGTLSGGEKFLTSISLALGLADVIQERAGGLKLEAIFIDEGFGTLDDQSLDRAMAILHDLGQHRSVGIISHVAELRQRIHRRVEVVKGKNGSTLRMI